MTLSNTSLVFDDAASLSSLFASILATAHAAQVPLGFGSNLRWEEEGKDILYEEDRIKWDINELPHPNDTDHLVLETVYSLLQHWPNTRMRNGIIPKGTLLYRGSNDDQLPAKPDWVATDPEHVYLFCRDTPPLQTSSYIPRGCWHLTLATTRSHMARGTLKIFLRGEIFFMWTVLLERNLEVMLCDFTSGVSVASLANLVNWKTVSSFASSIAFENINSASGRA